jgi:Flp pilus assembly protein TadG
MMTVNFSVVLLTLLIFVGFAVDAGNLQLHRRIAQRAADAAALGALYEKQRGSSNWAAAGKTDAATNGVTNGVNGATVTVVNPPTSGLYSGSSSAVQAVVTQKIQLTFLSLLRQSTATVGARAVSQAGASAFCVYSLDGTASRSMMIGGGGAGNFGCSLFVNSTSSSALHADGGGSITAKDIQVVGNYDTGSGSFSPSPTTGVSSVADPLASEPQPSFSSCNYNNTSITTTKTLNPGTYCGGMTISGGTVTLNPGLYIITGGLNWNNNSHVSGSGVTLFFTQGGGSGYGQVTISGGVVVTLTAPDSASGGSIPGILMFGDRNWVNTSQEVNFNGSSSVTMQGVLYFPHLGVIFSASANIAGNYFGLVADNITINGGATLKIPVPNYSSLTTGSPFQNGVVLAE